MAVYGYIFKIHFAKKNGRNWSFQPLTAVKIIYVLLYGVATTNWMIITEIQMSITEIIWLGN